MFSDAGTKLKLEKPVASKYKCNIGAFFSINLNKIVIGICIRDDQGQYMLPKTKCFTPICDMDIAGKYK